MPGRLLFKTTGDGANGSTERMRIDSGGRLLIGNTTGVPSNFDGGENNSYALLRIRGNTSSEVSDGRLTLATGYKAYQLGSGDGIGAIYFADDTGGDWASILCVADGQGGGNVKVTTKWDGAPAIICGRNPQTGKFFVGTKSVKAAYLISLQFHFFNST